jgi:hypothetical protein
MTREYQVVKYDTHEKMEKGVNALAREGWAPIHYAIQSWVGFGSNNRGFHYVMFVRQAEALAEAQKD